MSLRLRLLSLALRLTEKRRLARARDPVALRAGFEAGAALFRDPPGAAYASGTLGGSPAIRARCGPAAPGAALLYLHGGAGLVGSARTHRHLAAALARASGVEAWLIDYRLAPEHPFPAALEDATAALADLRARGAARIVLAGDSFGAGLAFGTLVAGRASGAPDPAGIVAFSPWCDMTMSGASLRDNARADAMLPAARMPDVVAMILRGADPRDPRASPVLARFETPPPPALIFAGRREILASDAEAMAETLRRAGGEATLRWSPAAPHAWPIFRGVVPESDAAVARAGAFISRHARNPARDLAI